MNLQSPAKRFVVTVLLGVALGCAQPRDLPQPAHSSDAAHPPASANPPTAAGTAEVNSDVLMLKPLQRTAAPAKLAPVSLPSTRVGDSAYLLSLAAAHFTVLSGREPNSVAELQTFASFWPRTTAGEDITYDFGMNPPRISVIDPTTGKPVIQPLVAGDHDYEGKGSRVRFGIKHFLDKLNSSPRHSEATTGSSDEGLQWSRVIGHASWTMTAQEARPYYLGTDVLLVLDRAIRHTVNFPTTLEDAAGALGADLRGLAICSQVGADLVVQFDGTQAYRTILQIEPGLVLDSVDYWQELGPGTGSSVVLSHAKFLKLGGTDAKWKTIGSYRIVK